MAFYELFSLTFLLTYLLTQLNV